MKPPAPLMRCNPDSYKNEFGHVCVIAGSKRMVGAAALVSVAAMRAGAGLVTAAVAQSLNSVVQKKISNVVMTLPLKETKEQTISEKAYFQIAREYDHFDVFAVGPGLSLHPSTQRFVLKLISASPRPLVIDADALNALAGHTQVLCKTDTMKVLTPHPGEMARLLNRPKSYIENNRKKAALEFAQKHQCVLLLKGHQTVVASPEGRVYINKTGNPGMATAGSGDVLTGIIAALLGQGLLSFEAAQFGAYWHGKAGDLAAKKKTPAAMIASDIIEEIPNALKKVMVDGA